MTAPRSKRPRPRSPCTVPILTYHSLDDSGSVISFPPAMFREQMGSFARRGFTGMSLASLLDAWDGRAPMAAHPVALTFDDGFATVLEHAAPVLAELGFSATVFAVAGACGRVNDWAQAAGTPRLALLSWSELATLRTAGFEVGGHSMTHAWLPGLQQARLRSEVVDSKRAIEDRLGAPVRSFAYPYGAFDAASLALVREHHAAAVGVAMGRAAMTDDRHLLRRIDAHYLRHPSLACSIGTLHGAAYLEARRAGRAVRDGLVRAGILPAPSGSMGKPNDGR